MADFQRSSDENTESINKVIAGLCSTLQAEKEALSCVCSEILVDNSRLNSYVLIKIEQLQKDLAMENTIMDKLAQKIEKAKVVSVKLNYTKKRLDDFESEKTVIKSCA